MHGMLTEAVVCPDEAPANQLLLYFTRRKTAGWFGRRTDCGYYRVRAACCGDSRASLVRDVLGMKRGRRSWTPRPATKDAALQGIYGSDGTRTRDLRRDRPAF
jgi:hypothetical protein